MANNENAPNSKRSWTDCRRKVIANTAIVASSSPLLNGRRELSLELFSREPMSFVVSLKYLDSLRMKPSGNEAVPDLPPCQSVGLRSATFQSPNQEIGRVLRGLDTRPVYYGSVRCSVANWQVRRAKYVGFRITPYSEGESSADCLYVERRKSDFGLTGSGQRFHAFLLTASQIDERINQVAKNYGMVNSVGEADTNALTSLMFSMYGGYDTPLLWTYEEEEDDDE